MGSLGLLTLGKTILVAGIGRLFGVSLIPAILAPGGDFAFVAFGINDVTLLVGISMAITSWLAAGGQLIAYCFEQEDVCSLLPVESE
ncbi:hypothetical protein Tco_1468823, partial [Tanacetum coccineum]